MTSRFLVTILMSFVLSTSSIAQTNTFPPTGNVGIGTLNPLEKLHVDGNSLFNNQVVLDFGTVNRRLKLTDYGMYVSRTVDGTYMSTITAPDNHLDFSTRNAHRFYVNEINSFNIQDQVVTSAVPLFVGGVVNGDPSFRLFVGNGNTSSPGNGILLENRRASIDGRNYLYFNLSDNDSYNIGVSKTVGFIGFNTVSNIRAMTNSQVISSGGAQFSLVDLQFLTYKSDGTYAERMRFTSDGYLGIGTSMPQSMLSVNGTADVNTLTVTTGDLYLANNGLAGVRHGCLSTHTYNACGTLGYLTFGFTANTGANTTTPDPLTIQQSNLSVGINKNNPQAKLHIVGAGVTSVTNTLLIQNSATNDLMRVNDDATFTFGTTALKAKMDVNGDITTRKVKVTQAGWPDYVFHKSYQLPTLEEVERYIKKHQHLPEVPSADNIAKDGLDLGDNQSILLKKIEELTLYVIEQNKKIEQMQSRIQELETNMPKKK